MIVIATHVEWVRQHDGPSIHPIPYFVPVAVSALAAGLFLLLRQRQAGSIRDRYNAEGASAPAQPMSPEYANRRHTEPDATLVRARRPGEGNDPAVRPNRGPETTPPPGTLSLMVTSGSSRDRQIPIPAGGMVLGRDDQLGPPFSTDLLVSRKHVSVHRCDDSSVEVADLGSVNGAFINGTKIHAQTRMRASDVLRIGKIELKLVPARSAETSRDDTPGFKPFSVVPDVTARTDGGTAGALSSRYYIDQQTGEVINNVGRDQFNAYVEHRENFLREIAATKTKARWLVWTGFLAFVVGFGLFAAGILGFIKQVGSAGETGGSVTSPFGPDIGGVPSGLLGWALAALGMLLLVVGIVLHIVATSRRKRVDRELPVLPPWPDTGP
jgi:Inner membrane component of T3SS, cytoplasmic domain